MYWNRFLINILWQKAYKLITKRTYVIIIWYGPNMAPWNDLQFTLILCYMYFWKDIRCTCQFCFLLIFILIQMPKILSWTSYFHAFFSPENIERLLEQKIFLSKTYVGDKKFVLIQNVAWSVLSIQNIFLFLTVFDWITKSVNLMSYTAS